MRSPAFWCSALGRLASTGPACQKLRRRWLSVHVFLLLCLSLSVSLSLSGSLSLFIYAFAFLFVHISSMRLGRTAQALWRAIVWRRSWGAEGQPAWLSSGPRTFGARRQRAPIRSAQGVAARLRRLPPARSPGPRRPSGPNACGPGSAPRSLQRPGYGFPPGFAELLRDCFDAVALQEISPPGVFEEADVATLKLACPAPQDGR